MACRTVEGAAAAAAARFGSMLFLQRMRTPADRAHVARAFEQAWGGPMPDLSRPTVLLTPDELSIGWARLPRDPQGGAAVRSGAACYNGDLQKHGQTFWPGKC